MHRPSACCRRRTQPNGSQDETESNAPKNNHLKTLVNIKVNSKTIQHHLHKGSSRIVIIFKSTQSTLGGGRQWPLYAFLNVDIIMHCIFIRDR